ncbi:MAG: ribonuclease P protein component [Gammaproteobacteria bacterium]|nr:hypothetical protein [Gammaproteobacteria bacterium]RPG35213.1 MAG: hypothetical protein CBD53_000515 [Gammaproteobacteria bacterium TMED193]
MKKNFSINKKNNIKKISPKMFSWEMNNITKTISVYRQKTEGPGSVLVMIPKKIVKSSVRRNEIRRKTKEIFRKGKSSSLGYHFLVKFKSNCDPEKDLFNEYLKNA